MPICTVLVARSCFFLSPRLMTRKFDSLCSTAAPRTTSTTFTAPPSQYVAACETFTRQSDQRASISISVRVIKLFSRYASTFLAFNKTAPLRAPMGRWSPMKHVARLQRDGCARRDSTTSSYLLGWRSVSRLQERLGSRATAKQQNCSASLGSFLHLPHWSMWAARRNSLIVNRPLRRRRRASAKQRSSYHK